MSKETAILLVILAVGVGFVGGMLLSREELLRYKKGMEDAEAALEKSTEKALDDRTRASETEDYLKKKLHYANIAIKDHEKTAFDLRRKLRDRNNRIAYLEEKLGDVIVDTVVRGEPQREQADGSKPRISPAKLARKEQEEFHRARSRSWREFSVATTDIQRSAIFNKAAEYTGTFFRDRNYKITNWQGVLTRVYTSHAGEKARITIRSHMGSFAVEYDSRSIPGQSEVYNQLLNIEKGEHVIFSGIVTPDDDTGIDEGSITEKGCVSEPEFWVRLTSVQKMP